MLSKEDYCHEAAGKITSKSSQDYQRIYDALYDAVDYGRYVCGKSTAKTGVMHVLNKGTYSCVDTGTEYVVPERIFCTVVRAESEHFVVLISSDQGTKELRVDKRGIYAQG